MPALGLGTFLGQGGALAEAVDYALHIGYRHIDTAHSYSNHKAIGDVLHQIFKDGKIKREDVFVTTKVPGRNLSTDGVPHILEESLEDLKLKQVDMLLAHTPFGYTAGPDYESVDTDIIQGWNALEKVFHEGKAKAIGVSNFSTRQIDRIVEKCKVEPANLQLECHAYLQQRELRKYCLQMGIAVSAYAPLGAPARPANRRCDDEPVTITQNPVIEEIAKEVGKSPAQVLLRYLSQFGVAPLPKSVTKSRIRENFDISDVRMNDAQIAQIKALDSGYKFFKFPQSIDHKEFPKGEHF